MDKLDIMLLQQESFQNKLGIDVARMNMKELQQYINVQLLAIYCETAEAQQETVWKNPNFVKYGWKEHQIYNPDNFKEEIIDIWHFLMNLINASGMSSQEFFDRYAQKLEINLKRQEGKY